MCYTVATPYKQAYISIPIKRHVYEGGLQKIRKSELKKILWIIFNVTEIQDHADRNTRP